MAEDHRPPACHQESKEDITEDAAFLNETSSRSFRGAVWARLRSDEYVQKRAEVLGWQSPEALQHTQKQLASMEKKLAEQFDGVRALLDEKTRRNNELERQLAEATLVKRPTIKNCSVGTQTTPVSLMSSTSSAVVASSANAPAKSSYSLGASPATGSPMTGSPAAPSPPSCGGKRKVIRRAPSRGSSSTLTGAPADPSPTADAPVPHSTSSRGAATLVSSSSSGTSTGKKQQLKKPSPVLSARSSIGTSISTGLPARSSRRTNSAAATR